MFIRNVDWKALPGPSAGDIIHLKKEDNLQEYLFKLIVSSVEDEKITGSVEAVFDWNTDYPITGGKILKYVGTTLIVDIDLIHRVIPVKL
jgi:hypothetical protein